jgi:hypothetical protein
MRGLGALNVRDVTGYIQGVVVDPSQDTVVTAGHISTSSCQAYTGMDLELLGFGIRV